MPPTPKPTQRIYFLIGILFFILVFYFLYRDISFKKEVRVWELKTNEISQSLGETRNLLAALSEGNQKTEARLLEEKKNRIAAEQSTGKNTAAVAERITSLNQELSAQKQAAAATDITKIIRDWSPRVAKFTCWFEDNASASQFTAKGSSVAGLIQGKFSLMTNKHVVNRDTGEALIECEAYFPESETKFKIPANKIQLSSSVDIAYADGTYDSRLPVVTISPLPYCAAKPDLGDHVVILGYPSVGAANTITATDGIISGFDNEYYITSAKIEQGNSGGAAILVKNNCFLGIPTLVLRGKLESLARILPVK